MPTTAAGRIKAPDHHCGAGGGLILRVRDVAVELRRATTNADVWSAEGGTNALYGDDSPICPACWMAYLVPIDKWSRSLLDPERFRTPLAPVIRKFPVPLKSRATVVYNQLYGAGTFTETVGFWCEQDDVLTKSFEDYAVKHALALDLEPGAGKQDQVLVSASFTRRV